MKVTLTFTLPDEEEEWRIVRNASVTRSAMLEFDEWLRGVVNVEPDRLPNASAIREEWYRVLEGNGVELD